MLVFYGMSKNTNSQAWLDQAKSAILQGQKLNEFVGHCHPDNRHEAHQAYKLAKLAIKPKTA